jgi:CBS domain-containing protein
MWMRCSTVTIHENKKENNMSSILEIMTPDPITIDASASLTDAGLLMQENRIRHIPVVSNDKELIGLVTQRDILAASTDNGPDKLISDVMRTSIYTISEDDELRAAALKMQKHKIGALPVLRNNQLIGIITDTDYVSLAINLLEQMDEIEPDECDAFEEIDELS